MGKRWFRFRHRIHLHLEGANLMATTGTIAVGEVKHLKASRAGIDLVASFNFSETSADGGHVDVGAAAADADGHVSVTGVSVGVATIHVTLGGSAGSIDITVTESPIELELI